ncbi:MAG: flagellar protein export ATPase FliI [Desulfobacteraceae bacterium]|nr:MAG: flagellar protein export ATPase FliI [Desulfobacteraceae bacterium]
MAENKYNTYCFPKIKDDGLSGMGDAVDALGQSDGLAKMLSDAEAEAFEQGKLQGRNQTLALEQDQMAALGELLSQARTLLADQQIQIRVNCEENTVRLALALARGIVAHQIGHQPDLADKIIRRAVEMAAGRECMKIKANPGDCETIRRTLQSMVPDVDSWNMVQISADPNLQKGGCVIETEFGVIDARIDQQIAAFAHSLASAMAESKAAIHRIAEMPMALENYRQKVRETAPIKIYGHVTKVVGLVVEASGPKVQLGCMCDIQGDEKQRPLMAEVLGFRDRTVLMMPLEDIKTIGPGSRVVARQERASISVGPQLLGRIINGLGQPIDGRGPLDTSSEYPVYADPINPLLRQRIRVPLDLGIRAINSLITVGCGQRMGIFAGSGVGKSVLMGMIARQSSADVNVIALIGERGRELNDFIEKELGEQGLKKSVVVVATSDHLPLVRVRGAFVATAIAEFFRDQGWTVNLMMDSLTRFAMAQREIGLALGEPPTSKGYTPSVFTLLPKLLERAGTSDHAGSITGLYTVLVEGDDMNEPIADAARSILDGHIVLSRELAHQNHYPAIDVLRSISRVMEDIATLQHKHNAGRLKEMLATYRKSEDLINIGAYVSGSNAAIDRAIAKIDRIQAFLRQGIDESIGFEQSLLQLDDLMNKQ